MREKKEFEKVVRKALERLPREIAEKLENVAICVEYKPSPQQQKTTGTRKDHVLLGLYEGISEIEWGKGFGGNPPDKITIFQESCEQFAQTKKELREIVRETVRHEIAHHFGFTDEELQEKERCSWAEGSSQMRAYHDKEWGVPQRSDRILFEYIVLDSFQAGLSWAIILKKRENFRKAFARFNPKSIAKYDRKKIENLLSDAGIVRNRGKIEATVQNAKVFLAIQKEFGSFNTYLWGWVKGRPVKNRWRHLRDIPARTLFSDNISSDLKKRGFRFFGSTTCYAFLQGSGLVNDHLVSCFRYKEV
ncbi:MAG TPA: DNA-3-methyladenine glycosylase I [Candidatus Paceibacterota bacterium]